MLNMGTLGWYLHGVFLLESTIPINLVGFGFVWVFFKQTNKPKPNETKQPQPGSSEFVDHIFPTIFLISGCT